MVYLVDMVIRAIDFKLNWQQRNQNTIFGGAPRNPVRSLHADHPDNEEDDVEGSGKTFLSGSFHGSVRHLRRKAREALCVVSEKGNPTLFITLTCNPKWKDIDDQLLEGQTAFDRPDIVCQVFHARLQSFLTNLRRGKYFGTNHKIEYLMYVIEYQHRGMPHAHIVLRLAHAPTVDHGEDLRADWIEQHICAELPDKQTDSEYYNAVSMHMIHRCAVAENGCKSEPNDHCKRGYDTHLVQLRTTFNDKGFPQYVRKTRDDLMVVPHNRKIFVDWDGHSNVE